MAEFKYTKEHECIYVEGDVAYVGISKYAQEALGDLVYIEFPEVGKVVGKGAVVVVIESVKTAAEVYSPVEGDVVAVNEEMAGGDYELVSAPVNENGWIVKVRVADVTALDVLMGEAAYALYLTEVD